ncbi:hypothetical protein L7F22_065856 [Adiantum nelumboides]|nr:hypothetical protein [Adiantum nelumboides]
MACRPLWGSLHRPARSLLSTRCFSSYRFQSDSPQSTALQKGALPSDFANVRPFSSAPQFFSRDRKEGQISDAAKEGCSSSSSAQELTENGSLDIPSPIDLLIDGFDTLNHLTGLPWWGTISVSAIILRALMLPLKVLQDCKLAEIRSQGPILQLERLARGLSQGKFLEECRQLRKRRQGVSSPSVLWILGPGICIQVPLVLTIVWSLRRMAVEQHLGFATMMIRAELSLLRSDIEKEMHTQVEIYKETMYADIRKELDKDLMSKKEEMYKSLKIEMQNSMRAEANVIECVVQKKLEDALLAFESWKSNTEKCINGKDALIEELKGELAECKKEQKKAVKDLEGKLVTLSEGMEARGTTQEKTADTQLQEELEEMKRQMETLKAEEAKKTQVAFSWAERLFKTQEKVEEAEKWIANAKQGKGPNGSLKVDNDLHSFLNEHAELFIDDISSELPPKRRDVDHRIDLIPGSSPSNKPPYQVSQAQQEEIMSQVNELVQKSMGGILWFKDLTVPGEGLVGAVLPLLVAAVYFGNVHVLFRGQPIRRVLLGEFEKAWRTFLKYSNFLTFWCICYAPQALQVFLVPHSIMTLAQTKLFSNAKFVTQVVGPSKNAAVKLPVASGDQDTTALSSYETLLKVACKFTGGHSTSMLSSCYQALVDSLQ